MVHLTRTPDDRWIAGVCGGIGDHLGIDPTIVRLAVVVGTILGFGSLVVAYLVAWALIPQRPRQAAWSQATAAPSTSDVR